MLRGWGGDRVVVTLEPDGTVMRGVLHEVDAAGIDGALFALREQTGIALAVFRDAVADAALEGDVLRLRQGRVAIAVRRERDA